MAEVKITSVSELDNLALDLKQKVTSSISSNVDTASSVLSNINDYTNEGFTANVKYIADGIKSNLYNLRTDTSNAAANLFNYADAINLFNINDYDAEASPVDLNSLASITLPPAVGASVAAVSTAAQETGEEEVVELPPEESQEEAGSENTGGSSYVAPWEESDSSSSGSSDSSGSNSSYSENNNTSNESNGGSAGASGGEPVTPEVPTNPLEQYLSTVEGNPIDASEGINVGDTSINFDLESDDNSLSAYTVSILNDTKYTNEGIATFNDRYVISTSTKYGEIGDFIDISQSDGTTLKCIIGSVDVSSVEPRIDFVVNQDTFAGSITDLHPNWLQGVSNISNKGNYFEFVNSGLLSSITGN